MHAPRVVIIHYHLRRGGVTHVIQNAVNALAAQGVECLVCSGSPPADGVAFDCPVHVEPALRYSDTPPAGTPCDLIKALCAACRSALGGDPDIWHIHNHALGKNASVPLLVDALAQQSRAMLLQIHDFAEDGRPANYRLLRDHVLNVSPTPALYPNASHIHYAALNHRDMLRLRSAGLTHVSVLHNPVIAPAPKDDTAPTSPLVLYPTRAIRRKNVGEFLLWAALRPQDGPYGVTLAPENPAERRFYDHWVALAQELALPVTFEMGTHEPFPRLLGRASALMTTSIAEGFGLAFVEPWLIGKPLVGRNLPDITSDFADRGIALDTLYNALRVPADWVDAHALKQRIAAQLTKTFRAYDREATEADLSHAVSATIEGQHMRFEHLDEDYQTQVICHCTTSPSAQQDVAPNALQYPSAKTIHANASSIRSAFSLSAYGTTLQALYTTLANTSADAQAPVSPDAVLNQFLSAERFMLLRS